MALMNVRALIASPREGDLLPRDETAIRGVAWSGAGSISKVDISLMTGRGAKRGWSANGGARLGNGGS